MHHDQHRDAIMRAARARNKMLDQLDRLGELLAEEYSETRTSEASPRQRRQTRETDDRPQPGEN